MSKEEIQVGDLVIPDHQHHYGGLEFVGLVIDDRGMGKYHLRYKVYWFSVNGAPPVLDFHLPESLIKLSLTQEKTE